MVQKYKHLFFQIMEMDLILFDSYLFKAYQQCVFERKPQTINEKDK